MSSDKTKMKKEAASREGVIRRYWSGKRIRYTMACFNEEHGSWCNDTSKPEGVQDMEVMNSIFKVVSVTNVGSLAKSMGVPDVHYMEDVRLAVVVIDGPFTGTGRYAAYGWEAVIVP